MSTTSARGALRALLSRSALESNLAALRATGAQGAADLRADAWGHGADFLADIVGESSPSEGALDNAALLGLREGFTPVMTLTGAVLSTKALRAGEGVSYGYTHRAAEDTTVALVSGGYAQGIVRALGNRVHTVIGGRWHPIIGRIAMDACVIDVGAAEVTTGERVEFFGANLPIQQWSDASGLTVAELVTAVGLRVPREVGA